MKYYIIPRNYIVDEIEAADAGEAIIDFATEMDSDMNIYFRAVTEEEYNEIQSANEKKEMIDFFINELEENLDIPEEDIQDVAEMAYECYRKSGSPGYGWAEGLTEYEALEMAVDEYLEGRDDDEEE